VGPIERKGSEDLAKSSATAVDPSNLGQAPRQNFSVFKIIVRSAVSSTDNVDKVVDSHVRENQDGYLKPFLTNLPIR